jgi:hypothetical protein
MEQAGAHAGEQDHHVELAGEEALGELEGGLVALQGRFAHGGGQHRFASLFANQLGDPGGAAALQRQDVHSGE